MKPRRPRASGEKGTVLPLVALGLVVLMGFAALAADAGNGYAERRRSQGAADASVLAAAVEGLGSGFTVQDMLDEALAFADNNLPNPPTEEEWRDCTDGESLLYTAADFTPPLTLDNHFGTINGYTTACFSISGGGDMLRVRLPNRNVKTHFAPVIGVDNLRVHAFAEAGLGLPGVSNAPPFVVTAGTPGGSQECLRTSSSGPQLPQVWQSGGPGTPPVAGSLLPAGTTPADPCDEAVYDPSTQFFGTLDPYFYTDVEPTSPPDTSCSNPGSNTIDFTIAEGIDHLLGAYGFPPGYTAGDPELIEGNGCPGGPPDFFPNTMALQSGFSAQRLKNGLLDASVTFDGKSVPGRLKRSANPLTGTFAGESMDNTPLWDFIRDDADTLTSADIPQQCIDVRTAWEGQSFTYDDLMWDYYDFKEATILCIQAWSSGDLEVFASAIAGNGRFAFIPVIAEGSLAASPVHFNEFVPIYLQKLYQTSNQAGFSSPECWEQDPTTPGGSGWHTHEAGQSFNCGRPNQNVDRLMSIVLECAMLPDDICIDGNPSTPGGDPVLVIELTR